MGVLAYQQDMDLPGYGKELKGEIVEIEYSTETGLKLLSSALPAVFASLTNNGTNWNAASISNLLNENKSNFAAALPAGLGLGAFETPIPPVDIPGCRTSVLPVPPVNPEPAIHTREAVREVKKSSGYGGSDPIGTVALWFLFEGNLTKEQFATALQQSPDNNIYKQLIRLSADLKAKDKRLTEMQQNLYFLIHLMGDAHQPMHVGRPADLGGNKIEVMWFGKTVGYIQPLLCDSQSGRL
ncbi:hypothetical protein FQR65_LT17573 [Abscondita terminalis]|nr:hypothetical protein FQR65_LT17573 [Abscondita terminalis]